MDQYLYKKKSHCSLFLPSEDGFHLQARKRVLTRDKICWHLNFGQVNAFTSIAVIKDQQKQFAFHTLTILLHGYISFAGLLQSRDHLFIPQKFMLVSYSDGIMVIGPSKKEVTTTQNIGKIIIGQMEKVNLTKNQVSATSVKFLGFQWSGTCQHSSSKGQIIAFGSSYHTDALLLGRPL